MTPDDDAEVLKINTATSQAVPCSHTLHPKMPKASSPTAPYPTNTNGLQPNVLKRNQACHQCRRRKLKCDAKRPCSTCVRSHAHAVAHSPAGTLPTAPECTFDEAETAVTVNDSPRNRYERLENRINELEALLLRKEKATAQDPSSRAQLPPSSPSPQSNMDFLTPPTREAKSGQDTPVFIDPSSAGSYSPNDIPLPTPETKSFPNGLHMQWPNWPSDLPTPPLLRHLVELFFVFHPHANRLFHGPTFMSSLSLPPTHPKFPIAPQLHAICAISSLYTSAVSSPPLPDFARIEPDEIFPLKYRVKEARPDSFAEQQAKLASEKATTLESMGDNLLQVLQARIILSWFFWSHARWVEVFTSTAHSLRVAVPLGLNVCPPFHTITKSQRPPSILPAARTVIEDETRRNVFWLAYATERSHGSGNGWCLSMDDFDVSQLLPVRGDQFVQGILVTPYDRQWAHSPDLLLVHPPTQTDSFTLYIKGTILMSRVKVFNHRFRARHFAGDVAVASLTAPMPGCSEGVMQVEAAGLGVDPRGSPAFIELDNYVSSFRASFPSHLRNPIVGDVVDNHLYTACLMPLLATIVLHDPHADVRKSGCVSALKILTAARGILDLIYSVWSTSFDITLLDSFCTFCWFSAGRVLARFLHSAMAANSEEQINTLRAEFEFVRSAIAKFGERIPLAYRFAKMLDDLLAQSKGLPPTPTAPVPTASPATTASSSSRVGEGTSHLNLLPLSAVPGPAPLTPTAQSRATSVGAMDSVNVLYDPGDLSLDELLQA